MNGSGLTVMLKLLALPAQPLATGVTVILAVTGTPLILLAMKEGILPVPLAERPMDGLSFVH